MEKQKRDTFTDIENSKESISKMDLSLCYA